MDQSKKTMRHFYCRDVLWETFEQMANDFDCSIDYLINEGMRFYARSKNYQAPAGASTGRQEAAPNRPPSLPESRATAGARPRTVAPAPPPGSLGDPTSIPGEPPRRAGTAPPALPATARRPTVPPSDAPTP